MVKEAPEVSETAEAIGHDLDHLLFWGLLKYHVDTRVWPLYEWKQMSALRVECRGHVRKGNMRIGGWGSCGQDVK